MTIRNWLRRAKIEAAEWLVLAVARPVSGWLAPVSDPCLAHLRGKRKILLTLVPTHGNLGDHAIAHASREYLRDNFSEFAVIEVSLGECHRRLKALKKIMEPGDVVMLLGGGNTGDLYREEEWTRRLVVRSFPELPVVSLPQTAHFSATRRGRSELGRARSVYKAHERLVFLARDPATERLLETEMPTLKVLPQPDMVHYLDERKPERVRHGVTVCLRQDKESGLSQSLRAEVVAALSMAVGPLKSFNTIVPRDVSPATRAAELAEIWDHLRGAQVAVTDRLHGVLFCLITGTPCVAVPSFDRKVVEAVERLAGKQDFIELVREPTPVSVIEGVRRALAIQQPRMNNLRQEFFGDLRHRICATLGNLDECLNSKRQT